MFDYTSLLGVKTKFQIIQQQKQTRKDTEISEIWNYVLKKNSGVAENDSSQKIFRKIRKREKSLSYSYRLIVIKEKILFKKM